MEYLITVLAVAFAAILCLVYCILALWQEILSALPEKKGPSCDPH